MSLIPYPEFKSLFPPTLPVTEEQYAKFATYASHLVEKNAVMNLTAITEPHDIAEKHFLDSVLPLTFFDIPEGASLVDVGTGAGFPGVPLKIMRPDLKLTLVDSLQKRVGFLTELCAMLDITAECHHLRAEDAGQGSLRESFDVAVARAVSRLSVLCEYCLPLVKVGGVFLAMKGGDCDAELREAYTAVKTLGGETEKVEKYALPNGDSRTLIVVRKVSATPAKYPRPQGKIKAKPL